jgi:hypothetical protein
LSGWHPFSPLPSCFRWVGLWDAAIGDALLRGISAAARRCCTCCCSSVVHAAPPGYMQNPIMHAPAPVCVRAG